MRPVKRECRLAPLEQAAYLRTFQDPVLRDSLEWQMAKYALTAAGIIERLPDQPISLLNGAVSKGSPTRWKAAT